MEFAGFDWDDGNRERCRKHGVSLRMIESLFDGPIDVLPDTTHSQAEQRFRAIGRTMAHRAVFVVFTLRQHEGETFLRPVSARYMHRKEARTYEKEGTDV